MEDESQKPKQAKPSFPRPSSHVAKNALINRLIPHSAHGRRLGGPKAVGGGLEPVKESESRPPEPVSSMAAGMMRPERPAVTFKENEAIDQRLVNPGKPSDKENNKSKRHKGKKLLMTSAQALQNRTHLQMDKALENGGLEELVEKLGTDMKKSGFTYLRTDSANNNPYKFVLGHEAPDMTDGKSYVTLSHVGITRGGTGGGDSDMHDFPQMLREQRLYAKLMDLRVFKQFRLWKPFRMWRLIVRQTLWNRRISMLKPRMHAQDEHISAVFTHVVHCAWDVREVQMIEFTQNHMYVNE